MWSATSSSRVVELLRERLLFGVRKLKAPAFAIDFPLTGEGLARDGKISGGGAARRLPTGRLTVHFRQPISNIRNSTKRLKGIMAFRLRKLQRPSTRSAPAFNARPALQRSADGAMAEFVQTCLGRRKIAGGRRNHRRQRVPSVWAKAMHSQKRMRPQHFVFARSLFSSRRKTIPHSTSPVAGGKRNCLINNIFSQPSYYY